MQNKPIKSTLLTANAPPHKCGFTLLEISIVIGIVALIIGMGVNAMDNVVQSARTTATNEKLRAIENALETFWLTNGRLPCPADASVTDSDTYYGLEAQNTTGNCTGGTHDATTTFPDNSIAEGMIPFATLNIPESYAVDAWGNRFTYAADTLMTATDAALRLDTNSQCADIPVAYMQDVNWGATATSWDLYENYMNHRNPGDTADINTIANYAYVVLSHGENEFGAYSKTGTRITNEDAAREEGINAWLLPTSPYTGDPAFSGDTRLGYIDGFDQYSGFDDVLRYKTIWQLNKNRINQGGLLQDVPVLFFSSSISPYMYAYKWDGDSFVRHTDITGTTPPAALTGGIATQGANCSKRVLSSEIGTTSSITQHQFATHYSNQLTISEPAALSAYAANDILTHPNRTDGALLTSSSPYVVFLDKVDQDNLTVCSSNCALDTDPGSTAVNGGDYSIYGHLAVAHDGGDYLTIYYDNSAGEHPRNKITAPAQLPPANAQDAAYSPDGNFLAVAHDSSIGIPLALYEIQGTNYSRLSHPATLPTGNATSVAFSADSQFLVVGHETTPFITVYKVDAATGSFTKLDDPSTLPSNTVNDVDFANTGSIFAAAVNSSTTPLMLYHIQHGEIVVKMTDPDVLPAGTTTGHAVKFTKSKIAIPTEGIIANGLIGRWRFDENSTGIIAVDSSTQGNDGSYVGAITFSYDTPTALTGSRHSIAFTGATTDKIDLTSIVDQTGDYTMSTWVKPTAIPYTLMGDHVASSDYIRVSATNQITVRVNSSDTSLNQGHTFTTGDWQHIVVVRESNVVSTYRNGVPPTTTNTAAGHHNLSRIGGYSAASNTNPVNGLLDDFRFYNRALSAAEVARIYNGDG